MLAIEPVCGLGAEEELGPVGAWSRIRHRQDARACVLQSEVLIVEFLPVDALSPSAVELSEVSRLAHEGGDDSVETAALVVQGQARLAHALLSGAEGSEVLYRLRHHLIRQGHLDAAHDGTLDLDIEVHSHSARSSCPLRHHHAVVFGNLGGGEVAAHGSFVQG
eukprot:CAMPEP_0173230208 /NCGR_PEP_ID=MMETSP1142-20121109/7626_1 /TAXON_ID=483371 /ORGANISM="non described non described, Strain CCMP2298" /LENGTH=163 /DNA_ID=CAMNT_0014159279 /DNA_START=969 /DNA_END=1460 /DNA_ORIENTATION=-